ncbi:MAG: hypothetical protein AAF226_06625 [Verrucomicrobiota bacterium]
MHSKIREALVHALGRHSIVCPVYCLMPDHAHFLLGGILDSPTGSNQRKAVARFRKEWNRQLSSGGYRLQKQPYDHVLRSDETKSLSAFQSVAGYILENPVRADLVVHYSEWEYLGCLIPGYPDISPSQPDFWDKFWKIYYRLLDQRNA